MAIPYQDVFPVLAEALPDFRASSEDWDDRLSYPFLSDMVRFVSDRAIPEFEPLMHQFGILLEGLTTEGDRDVQDLVHDGLETLWEKSDRDFVAR